MIALLVMTDGRDDVLAETLASFAANVTGPISERWIHDDTGDRHHSAHLAELYPDFTVVDSAGRSGFGGAIRNAWSRLRLGSGARFVFHLEDDFTWNRPADLGELADLLDLYPHLAQIAYRRQAWNAEEIAAGGIVEQHPEDYTDCAAGELQWLEHRRFFTTNPSLYRFDLLERGWPAGAHSEGRFSLDLFADPARRCAFIGPRDSPPWVHHIGATRAGTGY